MADSLISPIRFDLDSAVKKAEKDWDGTYASRLEKAIQKRALEIKLKFDTSKLDSLDAVKQRLAQLKIEPITPETKAAIRELAKELQALAKALEQVQKYSARAGGTPEAVRNSKIAANEAKAAATRELARQRAARAALAEYKLAQAREKSAIAAVRGAAATHTANREYANQSSYLQRLVQRMAAYWSIHQVSNFLTNVREVTAQFELQRVSLGAIIQDQTRANALFSEIKQFALKSPVSIMDLTKYTKQVAAYRIENDKLFDTTKRLADVSVGLGVDMGRLVLAYGQVKAASYLRAAEIRQFTEAGIPMLELLAEKFKKLNGEAVTTGQVMEMVSKRMVDFEMVEGIFNDMTSAGGMFYNMQEKQGNTLYGMWMKLGDAASVMYDQIGNTEGVNSGMKSLIETLTNLMRNWKAWAKTVQAWGAIIAALTVTLWLNQAATKADMLATEAYSLATRKMYLETIKSNLALSVSYKLMRLFGASTKQAIAATIAFSKAIKLIVATSFGAVVAGIMWLTEKLFEARENATRLENALKDIETESGIEQLKSVNNFRQLANAAVKAADGSKAQKDALDELSRTYKDIIPQEKLTIENLRAMKGNYDSLTQSVKTYVAEQMKQKQINTILDEYGKKIVDKTRDINKFFSEMWNEQQAGRLTESFKTIVEEDPEIGTADALRKAARQIGVSLDEIFNQTNKSGQQIVRMFDPLREAIADQTKEINGLGAAWNNNYAALGRYGNGYEKLADKVRKNPIEMGGNPEFDEDETPYFYKQQQQNLEIQKVMIPTLQKIMSDANVEWQDGWANMVDTVDTAQPHIISSINFDAINKYLNDNINALTGEQWNAVAKLQEIYEGIAISDRTALIFRSKLIQITRTSGIELDTMTKYFMNAGEDIEDYAKRIKEAIDELEKQLNQMQTDNQMLAEGGHGSLQGLSEDEIKEIQMQVAVLKELLPSFQESTKSSGSGRKSDPRLQNLKEEISLVQKLYSEYKQLEKQEGAGKAAKDMRKLAGVTIDMFKKKYGFDLPADAKDLTSALEILYKKMAALPKKVFPSLDKDLKELRWTIEKVNIDDSQKNIEAQLKQLADRISRTKTAREFYEKILGMTGDLELATKVSAGIYSDTGFDLQKQLAGQIRQLTNGLQLPESVVSADSNINYKALREWAETNKSELGKTYDELVKIAEQGQKDLAKTYEGYFKDLEKARTYASQRVRLAQTTAARIRQIRADMASGQTDKAVGESLISGLVDKEMKDAAKLEWDAFKGSSLYVQMFDDLENTSTSTLEMMRSRLEGLSQVWGNALDPTQLKEMQSRMNEITEQLRTRNPWKQLKEAYQQYKDATDSVTLTGAATKAGEASKNYYDTSVAYGADSVQAKAALQELQAREKIAGIVKQITAEQGKQVKGQKALTLAQQKAFDMEAQARTEVDAAAMELKKAEDKAIAEGKDPTKDPEVKAKREALKLAMEQLDITELVSNILAKQGKDIAEWRKSIASAANGIKQGFQMGADLAKGVADTMEALGGDGVDVQFWNDISAALGDISAGFQGIIDSAMSLNVGGIISNAIGVIPNMVTGFVGLFSAGKVRKANKEIKRQQELLDQLEYTYGRLEKAAEKAFGGEYIKNFKARQKNLQAQAEAYRKQAEAERSKGKKADKEKIKEYENAYRETMDEIADMQGQIAAQMLGTDLTGAARDFAQAWLDAYKEFGNTADAMSGKFREMIENMVVEGAMAKVMERALTPMFDMIDRMGDTDFYSESFWKNVVATAEQGAKDADAGAQTMMRFLEQAGISMRDLGGEYTGIAKEVASAGSEEINANTAALNTQNYYVSHLPAIGEDVAVIRRIMEASGAMASAESANEGIDRETWQREAFDRFAAMERYMAETVSECRNIANECRKQNDTLKKVISPKGGGSSVYQLNVRM